MSLKQEIMPVWVLHFAVFLFGMASLFGEGLTIGIYHLVFFRCFFAFLGLGGIQILLKEKIRIYFPVFFGQALLLCLHWISFFYAVQYGSLALAVISFSSYPLFSFIIDLYQNKIKNIVKNLFCIGLIIFGIIVLCYESFKEFQLISLCAGIFSALSFSVLMYCNQRKANAYHTIQIALSHNFISFLLLAPFVVIDYRTLMQWDHQTWIFLLLLGLVFTALSHSLFLWAASKLSGTFVAMVASMEPLYAILFSWILFGSRPSSGEWLGGIFIIVALFIYSSDWKKKDFELK